MSGQEPKGTAAFLFAKDTKRTTKTGQAKFEGEASRANSGRER
jgi:hypothetical protein